jgi:hypothetical protein
VDGRDLGHVRNTVNTGEACGALGAPTRCVVASQECSSHNNGASFEVLGRTDPLPDQLMAADMAVGSSNRLYLLHSYSYGLAGQNQQVTFTYSDDLVLSKEAEEVLLWRDIQNDLVQQLMRRLATAKLQPVKTR